MTLHSFIVPVQTATITRRIVNRTKREREKKKKMNDGITLLPHSNMYIEIYVLLFVCCSPFLPRWSSYTPIVLVYILSLSLSLYVYTYRFFTMMSLYIRLYSLITTTTTTTSLLHHHHAFIETKRRRK
jgi:hypothetical protein